jgi:hypothetical protein
VDPSPRVPGEQTADLPGCKSGIATDVDLIARARSPGEAIKPRHHEYDAGGPLETVSRRWLTLPA